MRPTTFLTAYRDARVERHASLLTAAHGAGNLLAAPAIPVGSASAPSAKEPVGAARTSALIGAGLTPRPSSGLARLRGTLTPAILHTSRRARTTRAPKSWGRSVLSRTTAAMEAGGT
jgi:hypothetical protein